MKKKKKILFIINIIIFVICLIIISFSWWQIKKIQIKMGLVEEKFPFKSYSTEELIKLFDQNPGANVETTQTPEQTHAIFIEYLKNKEVDEALKCCVAKSKREEIKEMIDIATEREMYDLMLSDISEIEEEFSYDNGAIYTYSGTLGDQKIGGIMKFLKNIAGVWLIESF